MNRLPIYEISSQATVSGRRPIKAILHEIHSDASRFQHNGISWNEEYTRMNLPSVSGMSIVAEFLSDERDSPYGHGLTDIKDNLPLFEDATMVGHFEKAYIDTVEVAGETRRVLIAEGTLDEMRYPKFVAWVREQIEMSSAVGSVEIVGKPENDGRIIYSDGWKEEGRIPQIYDYSGYAILGVAPADDAAVVMELNNKIDTKSEEEDVMDEKILEEIKSAVVNAVNETNTKNEESQAEINELNEKIATLTASLSEKEAELNALTEKVAQYEVDIAEKDTAVAEANEKIATIKADNAKAELNALLSSYSEEQKAVAKEEIDAFMDAPNALEINSIIGKICTEIVRASRDAEPDIFSMSGDDNDTTDDVNVF